MDEQILLTIKSYYGDLRSVKTDDFYKEYLAYCNAFGVEPRPKNVVIREACEICGAKTKQKTYTVFCKGD